MSAVSYSKISTYWNYLPVESFVVKLQINSLFILDLNKLYRLDFVAC